MYLRYSLYLFLIVFIAGCQTKKKATQKKTKPKVERVVIQKKETHKVVKETPPVTDESKIDNLPRNASFAEVLNAYIITYKDIAMEEMAQYGIPASITLAQGILESGAGRGELTQKANNHFGIKCHTTWTGERVYHDDDEAGECFRKYKDAKYSFRDHSLFLTQRSRYKDLFKLKKDDYVGWAKGLKKAGYATDPKYPDKLIAIIEKNNLTQFDKQVLGDVTKQSNASTSTKTHQVEKGDTLYSISKKYNTSVELLMKLNKLSNTNLSIGQTLIIE